MSEIRRREIGSIGTPPTTPPAGQAATGTDGELREAIAATLYAPDDPALWAGAGHDERRHCLAMADALLADPLAALVADREAVRRVRALLAEGDEQEWNGTTHNIRLRRALDGAET